MEQSWKQAKAVFAAALGPPLVWLVLFFLAPMAIVWAYSFGHNVGLTDIAISGTFHNYARAIEPLYLKIFLKSVWVAGLTTGLCLVIGFPVALAITFASDKAKAWLLLLIMLPFWTNLLIRTYALIAVFRTQGYVNLALGWVGLGPYDMLYNNFAVIFGLVYVYMPFMVLPLYATIERLDRSFLEASLDLGASQFQTFLKVTVPLTMPGIITGIILVFIPCLGSFLTPDLLGGANAVMIGNVIERQFKAANDWPFGAAISFLLMYATFGALALRALFARFSKGVGV